MENITKGISFTVTKTVTPELTALAMGSGDMEVFATPAMIALMENAAMLCVAPHLEEGNATVGIMISSSHTRATALSQEVSAKATVTEVDGRKITFTIEASDTKGTIGTATHERFVVGREKFLSRL